MLPNIAENDIDKMPKAVLGHFGKKKSKIMIR
jgi:hypothetical protein